MPREITPVPKATDAATRGRQNNQRGKAFERKIATETGGRRVPLSGGGSYKGDVTTRYVLLECKTSAVQNARGQKSISVPEEWLLKAAGEARDEGKLMWALPFRYKGSTHDWVVMDWEQVLGMFKQLAYLYELQEWLARHSDVARLIQQNGGPLGSDDAPIGLPLFSLTESAK